MGIGTRTVKYILLLLNFIFSILSLIIIIVGILALVSAANNTVNTGENVMGGLIVGLGELILILAIFGCLAAIHESRNKLLIYTGSMTVIVLSHLILLSMSTQGSRDGLWGGMRKGFDDLWVDEQTAPGALEFYENWLHCCGVNGTEDYLHIRHNIPKSCCIGHDCITETNIYQEGCLPKFEAYLSEKIMAFTIVGWLLVVGEVAAVIFGWILWTRVKNRSRRANGGWM